MASLPLREQARTPVLLNPCAAIAADRGLPAPKLARMQENARLHRSDIDRCLHFNHFLINTSMLLKRVAHHAVRLTSNAIKGNPLDLPRVVRRTGTWNHADLEWLASKVCLVAGDFAEIGVFRGAAFRKVATLAAQQGKRAHAFDSFIGMNEPTPEDGNYYPKGKFDIGGADQFVRLMTEAGLGRDCYEIWPGYVPDCFTAVPPDRHFSLAILDVDHYHPTVNALCWLAPRISPMGILALDDFLPHANILASKAIKEFLLTKHNFEKVAFFNQQLILRKLPATVGS
jgi:hypothetical protein